MAKLWHKVAKSGGKAQVEEAPPSQLPLHKPSVIFLAGIFTNDNQKEYISGDLNRIQELVESRDPSLPTADVYAWSHDPGLKNIFNLATYNRRPDKMHGKKLHALADTVLLPLTIDAHGAPLPLDDVKKNFRNITFIAYSAGTVTAQECYQETLREMIKSGFSDTDAKEALKEIVLIGMGNMSRPSKEKERFTTLYLSASNDHITNFNTWVWSPFKTAFMRISKKLQIKRVSGTSLLISAGMTKENKETRIVKERTWTETVSPLLPKWTRIRSNHEIARYLTRDDNLSPFAKIVFYGVANAVGRTRRLLPHELLLAPKVIPANDQKTFNDKISIAAIQRKKKKWWKK